MWPWVPSCSCCQWRPKSSQPGTMQLQSKVPNKSRFKKWNLSILLSLVLEWSLHPSWVHVICAVISIPSLIPVFQTHDLARIDAKVHRIFVEKFEIQILIKVVLPHRSFLNHLRIQFWCNDLESSNWNILKQLLKMGLKGTRSGFLVLNLMTLRSIHSLGSYPWGPWSASACPQKTTWRKMPLKKRVSQGGKPPTLTSSRVEKLKKGNCGAGIVRLALWRQKCVEGV